MSGRRIINNVKKRSIISQKISNATPSTSSSCCGAPTLPGCTDAGFDGSLVQAYGGTTIQQPSDCPFSSNGLTSVTDHNIGAHPNVSKMADCPNDGDVLMWQAGDDCHPGKWVPMSVVDIFRYNCLIVPDDDPGCGGP